MAFLGAAPFFTAWLFLIRYHFFLYLHTAKPAYGWLWGFFNPCVFSSPQEEEKNFRFLTLQLFLILLIIIQIIYISRHTVVCRAAQEAGAQPREYIDRKKQNAIFAPP